MVDVRVVKKENGKWAVLLDGLLYDYFDSEDEARREARLLKKVEGTLEEINELVWDKIMSLSKEERRFLSEYVGGQIVFNLEEAEEK